MNNINEFLEKIVEFENFASVRAEQLLLAQGNKNKLLFNEVEYQEDMVLFTFRVNQYFDILDSYCISLNIEQLEMSDSDWNKYIENTTKETKEKEENLKKEKQLADLNLKNKN